MELNNLEIADAEILEEIEDGFYSYLEPHESGGTCKTTLTRKQAIDWMRKTHKDEFSSDRDLFLQWASLHHAQKEIEGEEQKVEIIKIGDIFACKIMRMTASEAFDALTSTVRTMLGGNAYVKGFDQEPSKEEILQLVKETKI